MSVTVRVLEARSLQRLEGSIKCSVKLKEGSRESLPQYTATVLESNNPSWGDSASVTLDTYGYDLNYAAVLISVLSGGENVGSVEVPISRILDNAAEFEDRKLYVILFECRVQCHTFVAKFNLLLVPAYPLFINLPIL